MGRVGVGAGVKARLGWLTLAAQRLSTVPEISRQQSTFGYLAQSVELVGWSARALDLAGSAIKSVIQALPSLPTIKGYRCWFVAPAKNGFLLKNRVFIKSPLLLKVEVSIHPIKSLLPQGEGWDEEI